MRTLRQRIVRARGFRLRESFLPGPLRRASVALAAMLLFGCVSAAKQVATHQVARDFYRHRFDETCHSPTTVKAWCQGFDAKLNRYDADLREGVDALVWVQKSGAKMPLQLKALDLDKKALEAGYKP